MGVLVGDLSRFSGKIYVVLMSLSPLRGGLRMRLIEEFLMGLLLHFGLIDGLVIALSKWPSQGCFHSRCRKRRQLEMWR
jgi:hypothetical protein